MRIRKRFPLSSPPSVSPSVSDPQLSQSPPVQPSSLQLHPIGNNSDSQPLDPPIPIQPLPSDHPSLIGGVNSRHLDVYTDHKFEIKQKEVEQVKEAEGGSSNSRKHNIFFAAAPMAETRVFSPSSSHQAEERWFDGDKTVPLKKRRGIGKPGEDIQFEKEKNSKPKMNSKTNKKCSYTIGVQQNLGEQDKVAKDDKCSTNNSNVKKIIRRGGAIMEGSRCSRVNGRGWRCCQQTLVGYSLCEHHLGKGRLRSITSVKGRANKIPTTAGATTTTVAPHKDGDSNTEQTILEKKVRAFSSAVEPKKVRAFSSAVEPARDNKEMILLDGSCYDDDDEEEDEDDDADYDDEEIKKPLSGNKKRTKLGMVKARSLSSLLNQTNNAVVVVPDDHSNNV